MGIGDEIMLAGEAARRAAGRAVKFRMLDKSGAPKWHFVWERAEHVARPNEAYEGVIGYINRRRHYIENVTPRQYAWREYQPHPARFNLTARALEVYRRRARGCIVFNPHIKPSASPNKQWGLERWRALIAEGRDYHWLQLREPGALVIRGADYLDTPDLWAALAALSGAAGAVLHEGALHHAAAAVSARAVVLFGGYISPQVTGYAGQRSLHVADARWPLGCGMRNACGHCQDVMAGLAPGAVLAELKGLLNEHCAAVPDTRAPDAAAGDGGLVSGHGGVTG